MNKTLINIVFMYLFIYINLLYQFFTQVNISYFLNMKYTCETNKKTRVSYIQENLLLFRRNL